MLSFQSGIRVLALVLGGLLAAAPALAVPINPGQTLQETVRGTAEIYAAKGYANSSGNGISTDPVEITFTPGAANVFRFLASGVIGCCSAIDPVFTPDGAGGTTSITSTVAEFSSISGNTRLPLVGLFTNATSPAAPAAQVIDATSTATAFAPLLNQVFFIGDGRAGFKNATGAQQQFTAPVGATTLWLGVVDGFAFTGPSSYYGDNPGSFSVDVTLARQTPGIPAPSGLLLLLIGLGVLGARSRHSAVASPSRT